MPLTAIVSRRLFSGSGGRLAGDSAGEIRPGPKAGHSQPTEISIALIRALLRCGADGRSVGMLSLEESRPAFPTAQPGVFSHYRPLAPGHRFGPAAGDWGSTAELQDDGSVRANWSHDDIHPFDLTAVYRWIAPIPST